MSGWRSAPQHYFMVPVIRFPTKHILVQPHCSPPYSPPSPILHSLPPLCMLNLFSTSDYINKFNISQVSANSALPTSIYVKICSLAWLSAWILTFARNETIKSSCIGIKQTQYRDLLCKIIPTIYMPVCHCTEYLDPQELCTPNIWLSPDLPESDPFTRRVCGCPHPISIPNPSLLGNIQQKVGSI